ncbi:hypothetical protein WKI44_23525 [Vibrio alginolyticus]|uniref:hypothetical protein n=1 Tax=Vibrio alginolyticus TaxID=663 RepID=UPI0021CF3E36
MVQIRKLTDMNAEHLDNYVEGINKIRSHYRWSEKIYDKSNLNHIYLVVFCNQVVGFFEATVEDIDLRFKNYIHIFLHEIHFSGVAQGKGYGFEVLNYLLTKGHILKMVVVNENEAMNKLVNKFSIQKKFVSDNVTSYTISLT